MAQKNINNNQEEKALHKVRHSLSHIMADAITSKYPEARLGIGPVIENGFYYDIDFPSTDSHGFSEKELPQLEKDMRKLINNHIAFKKKAITPAQAKKLFARNSYKLELIEELKKAKKPITIYESGTFVDLCAGPHVKNTKEINPEAFALTHIAGAYWRGDEKQPQLTRIYGVAFATKKELEEYRERIKEAQKRDHRKLGKELDLFHIDEKVGLGLPLWHPRGALLWRLIEDFWYQKHLENGYELVRTPHIGNRSLWETSGHWGFYNASMYPPLEVGQTLEEKQNNKEVQTSEEYILKPMNCPFHVQIYNNTPRSYKELPFRWAETGTVYRFEKKGELSGLTRVRGFTQDDAHIICTKDQVEKELKKVIDFILFMLTAFGFKKKDIHVYLSLRDPRNTKKYAGDNAGWKFSQSILKAVAKEKKLDFVEEEGEAAFYGPKLDFKIQDAIGREWQCSTLQFDFNLPKRFAMTYINAQGKEEQPYMLHRALFGSFERFIGLLIEHYAGDLPLWLAPVQATILPVSIKQKSYAEKIKTALEQQSIRVTVPQPDATLGKRIREAELQKVPYSIIIGEKEQSESSVSIRSRANGDEGQLPSQEFIDRIVHERDTKK